MYGLPKKEQIHGILKMVLWATNKKTMGSWIILTGWILKCSLNFMFKKKREGWYTILY